MRITPIVGSATTGLKPLRPRTLRERMPEEKWEKMLFLNVIVFAPSPEVWGEAIPWYTPGGGPERHSQLIYLSPNLEKRLQQCVNVTVAHETCARDLRSLQGYPGATPTGTNGRPTN